MALYRAGGISRGNVYAEVGDVTLSTSGATKITLGWQPDEVWTFASETPISSSPTNNGVNLTTLADNGKAFFRGPQSQELYSLPSSTANRIASIDADGFTMNKADRQYCRYIAYKFK